jgi:hypothetical protein
MAFLRGMVTWKKLFYFTMFNTCQFNATAIQWVHCSTLCE